MSVRIRLILALLVTSVLPLSAVTLYSYRSSARALEAAVEAEARTRASELTTRMEFVTRELGHRMESVWMARAAAAGEQEDATSVSQPEALRGAVTSALGDVASLVDRVEFVGIPSPPPPPPQTTKPRGRRPAPPRTPSRVAGVSISEGRVVVDLHQAGVSEAAALIGSAVAAGAVANLPALIRQAERLAETATSDPSGAAALNEVRQQIRALEQAARERRVARSNAFAKLEGADFNLVVPTGSTGAPNVHARLNLKRVLGAILGMSRSDQGEIPFAIDADGNLHALNPEQHQRLDSIDLVSKVRAMGDEGGELRLNDWIVVTRVDPSGLVFGIARRIGEPLDEIRRASVRNLGLGIGIVGLAVLLVVPLSNRMTRNLSLLSDGARQIAKGDLNVRVPVRSRDEFGALAETFNQMVHDLESHQKLVVEQERLKRELELCRQIQNDMLPRGPLRLGLAEVSGVSIPAREVGGDFFNYFLLPDGRLALLVGDVSGKGVGAALLMANIQATLRARLPLQLRLAELAASLDQEIAESTPPEVYSTLFVAVLDPAARTLRYVNAGHNTQFVLHAAGELERLTSTGLPLGLMPGREYEERTVSLADGDLLFFYTDGAVEVQNEADEMFTSERLERLLGEAGGQNVGAILAGIEGTLRAFRGRVEPADDATMMALRFGPHPAA